MEVTLLNTNHMPNGWLANQLNGFWKDFARDVDGRAATTTHYRPAADIVEDADSYQFSFEMPGLKKDSVDVRVEDGHLIIEAERVRPELAKDAQVHLHERTYGPIRRTFQMPEDALTDGIAASYRDGILDVRVPKKPETKPLRIKVNAD
jgi:HSP20 family protein